MARFVIKLGSAVVATDDGELRTELLERACDTVAAARGRGDEVVIVTSGAIARGTRELGLTARPSAIGGAPGGLGGRAGAALPRL